MLKTVEQSENYTNIVTSENEIKFAVNMSIQAEP